METNNRVRRAEAHGAGPFLHVTIPAPNWVERGELIKDCKLEVALGYAGDRQVEFLGPGHGTQHYARELVDEDVVFHHVGIYQFGMDELAKNITSAGYPEVVRGGVSYGKALSFDFRYFDSRAELGIYLEVQDFRLLNRELSIEPVIQRLQRRPATARPLLHRLRLRKRDVKLNARPDGFRHRVRGLFVKRPYADAADLDGKTAIVTGASPRSIGCDTALAPIEAFFLKSPEEGAQTSIHCATHPGLEGGRCFENCAPLDPGEDAQDPEVAASLWKETETWIG